jgi:hypothetical protein
MSDKAITMAGRLRIARDLFFSTAFSDGKRCLKCSAIEECHEKKKHPYFRDNLTWIEWEASHKGLLDE